MSGSKLSTFFGENIKGESQDFPVPGALIAVQTIDQWKLQWNQETVI